MTSHEWTLLSVACLALLASQASCSKGDGGPSGPDTTTAVPSLEPLNGTCAVEKFEIWSTNLPVPPAVSLLYDAAANGYVATLRITVSSRLSGSYVLSATSRDPLRVGDVAGGTLSLVEPDSVRFSGATSLPGTTKFALAGRLLTLVNPTARTVTLPPGPYQVTTRIECRR
jgi:hypothetical protein